MTRDRDVNWRAIRALVLAAVDAYFATLRSVPRGSLHSQLPRNLVFVHQDGDHTITLYGYARAWKCHAHYHGPHGHARCMITRHVDWPEPIAASLEDTMAEYAEGMAKVIARPHLTAAQVQEIWDLGRRAGMARGAIEALAKADHGVNVNGLTLVAWAALRGTLIKRAAPAKPVRPLQAPDTQATIKSLWG